MQGINARVGYKNDGIAEKPGRRWQGNQEPTAAPGLEVLEGEAA